MVLRVIMNDYMRRASILTRQTLLKLEVKKQEGREIRQRAKQKVPNCHKVEPEQGICCTALKEVPCSNID